MEHKLARYHELKLRQKQVEEELEQLRAQILQSCPVPGSYDTDFYKLTVSLQERREYDDNRLFNALPDASIWRLLSKADPGKIASLIKLDVIQENTLDGTYERKQVPYIRISKR